MNPEDQLQNELSSLQQLFERRTHELKSMKLLVKQKEEETKDFYYFCGDNPTYQRLQDILSDKLTESENQLNDQKKRIRDLRQKKNELATDKLEANRLSITATELSKETNNLTQSISRLSSEFNVKSQQIDQKKKELFLKQKELENIEKQLTEAQKLVNSSKEVESKLIQEKKMLEQQKKNLTDSTQETKNRSQKLKSSINPSILQEMQKESTNLTLLLEQTEILPIETSNLINENDLDPIFKDQIDSMNAKVQNLKQKLIESQNKFDDNRKRHKIQMNEYRIKLENLKKSNNTVKNSIESIEYSIPQTLAPLTRELEMWRSKVDQASKESKENEQSINQRRIEIETSLSNSEKQILSLQENLNKINHQIKQQKDENEQKNQELQVLRNNLNNLVELEQSLQNGISDMKTQISTLNVEISSVNEAIQKNQAEMKETESSYALELSKMKEESQKMKSKPIKQQSKAENERLSTPLDHWECNDSSIKDSVISLQKELEVKKKQLEETNEKYQKIADMQKRFHAAVDLIADLDSEEKCLIDELKMIRKQFEVSIQTLRENKKNSETK